MSPKLTDLNYFERESSLRVARHFREKDLTVTASGSKANARMSPDVRLVTGFHNPEIDESCNLLRVSI